MRLLGWGSDRIEAVDLALRSIRMAAAHRVALVLDGAGDLVPIAHSIHRHSRGVGRPFIVCDPRRQSGVATVRSAENFSAGMDAFRAAAGGSLCVRTRRLPRDFPAVIKMLRAPRSRVQLIVCAAASEDCEVYGVTPIAIPSLATRTAEIDHIISECVADAKLELALPTSEFSLDDRAWVRQHAATSLAEIEKATLRLIAVRNSRNFAEAAARLRMTQVSLTRWMNRRNSALGVLS
jgi:hypothetical protein